MAQHLASDPTPVETVSLKTILDAVLEHQRTSNARLDRQEQLWGQTRSELEQLKEAFRSQHEDQFSTLSGLWMQSLREIHKRLDDIYAYANAENDVYLQGNMTDSTFDEEYEAKDFTQLACGLDIDREDDFTPGFSEQQLSTDALLRDISHPLPAFGYGGTVEESSDVLSFQNTTSAVGGLHEAEWSTIDENDESQSRFSPNYAESSTMDPVSSVSFKAKSQRAIAAMYPSPQSKASHTSLTFPMFRHASYQSRTSSPTSRFSMDSESATSVTSPGGTQDPPALQSDNWSISQVDDLVRSHTPPSNDLSDGMNDSEMVHIPADLTSTSGSFSSPHSGEHSWRSKTGLDGSLSPMSSITDSEDDMESNSIPKRRERKAIKQSSSVKSVNVVRLLVSSGANKRSPQKRRYEPGRDSFSSTSPAKMHKKGPLTLRTPQKSGRGDPTAKSKTRIRFQVSSHPRVGPLRWPDPISPASKPPTDWIACDRCGVWYHMCCVGLAPPLDDESIEHFHCPPCTMGQPQFTQVTDHRKELCSRPGCKYNDDKAMFFVKRIIGKMKDFYGKDIWLVEWDGYPLSQATWEPMSSMSEAGPGLIKAFNNALADAGVENVPDSVLLPEVAKKIPAKLLIAFPYR